MAEVLFIVFVVLVALAIAILFDGLGTMERRIIDLEMKTTYVERSHEGVVYLTEIWINGEHYTVSIDGDVQATEGLTDAMD